MASAETARILEFLRSLPRAATAAEAVTGMRYMMETAVAPPPRGTELHTVSAGEVPAEWVRCGPVDPDRRLLYLHGGAYVSGSRVSHRALAARLGRATGCAVLLPEYRLAPEHPHPAALDDAAAAWRWMLDHGPTGDAAATHALVAGDSAGGGLALALMLRLKAEGAPMPTAAAVLSPWTDLAGTGASVAANATRDPMLQADLVKPCAALYLGDAAADAPLCSPLYGDLAGLPPLLLHVGEIEVLLDDSVRFADKAERAGVEVTLKVWPEMFHVFQAFAAMLPEGREAIAEIGAFLRAQMDRAPR
jgi:acetyl esterase/lipase